MDWSSVLMASQASFSWGAWDLGRSPSQERAENPHFCRMRRTRSDAFLRYSSGA